jgi:hypothetical protein
VIVIPDFGTGTIVGWSFKHYTRLSSYDNVKKAKEDCRRKGGQNPKVVALW